VNSRAEALPRATSFNGDGRSGDAMNQFQHVFPGSDGDGDQRDLRYNDDEGGPKIDGI
jgi:hypothetical protein